MKVRTRIVAALLALALVWFGTLQYRKLVKPDEGRYAEIPREMIATGDWLTPRLNGIKYFEKPPLQYWATAAAYEAFGTVEWTSRLWTALTGFAGLLLAGFTARRLFGPTAGLVAVATLASSLLYLAMAHIDTLDMGFTFFLELAVFGFLLAQDGARRWMLLGWIGLGLAVLSKGIAALVLTGGTLVLYSLLTRDWSPWRRFEFLRGLPLFLLITAPWFVAVSMANPEFPNFFFIHEHFDRFLTKVHRRYEPVWFFIPVLLLGALPWTTLALQALGEAWSRRAMPEFQVRRFLLLWCVVVFGFFSVSNSKLPSYILPMFPALALLLADFLNRVTRRTLLRHLAVAVVVALSALILAPRFIEQADEVTPMEMVGPYAEWLIIAAAIWFAATLAALGLAWRQRRTAAVLALSVGALVAGMIALLGHENLNGSSSAWSVAQKVKPLLAPGVPFYSYRMYDQTLPFYIERTVTLVAHPDEMAFGLAQEPNKWLPSMDDFKRHWNSDADAFAIMELDDYDALRQEGLPMTEIARDTRRVIVRKPQS